jgi:hypothetical protein
MTRVLPRESGLAALATNLYQKTWYKVVSHVICEIVLLLLTEQNGRLHGSSTSFLPLLGLLYLTNRLYPYPLLEDASRMKLENSRAKSLYSASMLCRHNTQ